MTSESGYNGWTNYETWAVKLWLDNDQGSQEMAFEMAREAQRSKYPRAMLADALKEIHEENAPEIGNNVYSDLLGSALGSVDWYEIAKAFLEDVAEIDAYEEA
jgi:hypothetical protein